MVAPGFQFDTSYTRLPPAFYHRLVPDPVTQPSLVLLNERLANQLGLSFEDLALQEQAALLAGNQMPPASTPLVMAYAGHQFGHFTLLGDGRAHLLGEHIAPDGSRFDLQFKGSGQTPFSRRGDGRAALEPMLREYLISEAMHELGIPTTRSLSVVQTGELVQRETPLKGAVLLRVAQSHLRVGTFQWAAAQGKPEWLQALVDYTIERHYPACLDHANPPLAMLEQCISRQMNLIVEWMRVGFIHGVMNTDNMTLSGETIDYGPCAFLDHYHPEKVFSYIDRGGRYAFGNQSRVAWWNLARLAETLLPLLDATPSKAIEKAEAILNTFEEQFQQRWLDMMRCKCGLVKPLPDDAELIQSLLTWMQETKADYTLTFASLTHPSMPWEGSGPSVRHADWYEQWQQRLREEGSDPNTSFALMQAHNPVIIPRNHQVERALKAASMDDLGLLENLLKALKAPYQLESKPKDLLQPPSETEAIRHTYCGT